MILDDLRKRLERLDEDADLMIDNNDRYQMVIVGGSAFILWGKLTRATHDIDALSVPKERYSLLGKYDINTDAVSYTHLVCVFENKRPNGKAFLYFTIKPLLFAIEQTQVATTVIHLSLIHILKSRMDRKFSRIENLWPRDGSCPLPLRSTRIFNKCFRIVKTQK